MNQTAYAGDHQQHDRGELINVKGEVQLERTDRQPAPEADDDRRMRWTVP
jgi:hypothetical protein